MGTLASHVSMVELRWSGCVRGWDAIDTSSSVVRVKAGSHLHLSLVSIWLLELLGWLTLVVISTITVIGSATVTVGRARPDRTLLLMEVQVCIALGLVDVPNLPDSFADIEWLKSGHVLDSLRFACSFLAFAGCNGLRSSQGCHEKILTELISVRVETDTAHVIRLLEHEFICKEERIDLVNDLLCLGNWCLNA